MTYMLNVHIESTGNSIVASMQVETYPQLRAMVTDIRNMQSKWTEPRIYEIKLIRTPAHRTIVYFDRAGLMRDPLTESLISMEYEILYTLERLEEIVTDIKSHETPFQFVTWLVDETVSPTLTRIMDSEILSIQFRNHITRALRDLGEGDEIPQYLLRDIINATTIDNDETCEQVGFVTLSEERADYYTIAFSGTTAINKNRTLEDICPCTDGSRTYTQSLPNRFGRIMRKVEYDKKQS